MSNAIKREKSATATAQQQQAASSQPTLDAVSQTPILVSEQRVMFGSAPALSQQPRATHWWAAAASAVWSATHRIHTTSAHDDHPVHCDCQKRYTFLEEACLAREMYRL